MPARGRRTALMLLSAVVTVGLCAAAWPRLPRVPVGLLSADSESVVLAREIETDFGMTNPVAWVVAARRGSVWTPSMLARVQALTRDVLTIPGVIALDVVSLASPNMRDLQVTEDMLEPIYLMPDAPRTARGVDAVRRRVAENPNYRGTLVSEDGRAAMIVANFTDDADSEVVGTRARELRERYADAETLVYVVGAPVLIDAARRTAPALAVGFAGLLLLGLFVLAISLGLRRALAATLAAIVACGWAAAALVAAGRAVLPWTVYGLPATALVAAAFVATAASGRRWREFVPLALGFVGLAFLADQPGAAFGAAGAVGLAGAALAGLSLRCLANRRLVAAFHPFLVRIGTLILVGIALFGLTRLSCSFAAFGYGLGYLPRSATADLRGLAEHFPPPVSLAVRFRGASGFVQSPDVLNAVDALADAVRADPAVVRVLSLADLVKMVHRAFNENRAEFAFVPEQRGLIARYLALAYSPGFRRFVDRGFTQSALWVFLSSDRLTDLERVQRKLRDQLVARPIPDATVDLFGGDGALVMAAAHLARSLATGGAVLLLLAASGIGLLSGWRTGLAALAGGLTALAFGAGACGWLGVPIDLVSLPCLVGAVAAGAALSALDGGWRLVPALSAMAVLSAVASIWGGGSFALIAILLAAPAVAVAVSGEPASALDQ